ncbi:DUF6777 domain-containing protein [Streptomyces sp. NPDC020883]|uniref:DUF6777 domain-containing protein n=1 Tax=Streptomyces sp. NPDC020883 TaxID=3365099 RepID=UPI0037B2D2A1
MTSSPPPDDQPGREPIGPPSGPLTPTGDSHPPTRVSPQPGRPTVPGTGGAPPPVDTGGGGGGGGDGGGGGGDGDRGGPGGGPPGPSRPWWRSAPRIALAAAVVVVAVVLAVVLPRLGGGGTAGALHLESARSSGPAPYTDSTVNGDGTASPTATPSVAPHGDHQAMSVSGAAPGLYGGSQSKASCDVEKQIRYLDRDRDKAQAFAGVVGTSVGELPTYLRSLTPVQLRVDTWVTNHGYQDGKPTSYQAVLQAGTAVLVDALGVPRVRCACGNPLTKPAAGGQGLTTQGKPWPEFRDSDVVTVQPAPEPVQTFVLKDGVNGQYFSRPQGTDGSTDQPAPAPSSSPFSPPPSAPSSPSSPGSGTPQSPQSPGGTSPESPSSPGSTPGSPSTPEQPTPGSTTPEQPGGSVTPSTPTGSGSS